MAIKINGVTVIDDDKTFIGSTVCATTFCGSAAGLTNVPSSVNFNSSVKLSGNSTANLNLSCSQYYDIRANTNLTINCICNPDNKTNFLLRTISNKNSFVSLPNSVIASCRNISTAQSFDTYEYTLANNCWYVSSVYPSSGLVDGDLKACYSFPDIDTQVNGCLYNAIINPLCQVAAPSYVPSITCCGVQTTLNDMLCCTFNKVSWYPCAYNVTSGYYSENTDCNFCLYSSRHFEPLVLCSKGKTYLAFSYKFTCGGVLVASSCCRYNYLYGIIFAEKTPSGLVPKSFLQTLCKSECVVQEQCVTQGCTNCDVEKSIAFAYSEQADALLVATQKIYVKNQTGCYSCFTVENYSLSCALNGVACVKQVLYSTAPHPGCQCAGTACFWCNFCSPEFVRFMQYTQNHNLDCCSFPASLTSPVCIYNAYYNPNLNFCCGCVTMAKIKFWKSGTCICTDTCCVSVCHNGISPVPTPCGGGIFFKTVSSFDNKYYALINSVFAGPICSPIRDGFASMCAYTGMYTLVDSTNTSCSSSLTLQKCDLCTISGAAWPSSSAFPTIAVRTDCCMCHMFIRVAGQDYGVSSNPSRSADYFAIVTRCNDAYSINLSCAVTSSCCACACCTCIPFTCGASLPIMICNELCCAFGRAANTTSTTYCTWINDVCYGFCFNGTTWSVNKNASWQGEANACTCFTKCFDPAVYVRNYYDNDGNKVNPFGFSLMSDTCLFNL